MVKVPAWGFTRAQSEAKERFNLPLSITKDFALCYSTGLMKESSLRMKELASALRLSFSGAGVLDLLGGAVGLLGEVGHLDGLGSTLCQYLISNCSDVQDAAMMVAGMIGWRCENCEG